MKCADAQRLFDEYFDGELAERLTAEVREHIASCEACAAEAALYEKVNAFVCARPLLAAPATATARVLETVAGIAAERRDAEREAEAQRFVVPVSRARALWAWAGANRRRAAALATGVAAALVFAVLQAWGVMPAERGPLSGRASGAVGSLKAYASSIAGQAAESVRPYSQAAEETASSTGMAGAFTVAGIVALSIVVIILLAASLESNVLARRIEAKYRYLR